MYTYIEYAQYNVMYLVAIVLYITATSQQTVVLNQYKGTAQCTEASATMNFIFTISISKHVFI